jgi:ribonuclease HIII
MAKTNTTTVKIYKSNKVSRPGVHAKSKSSKLKKSKNYKKAYRAQGR